LQAIEDWLVRIGRRWGLGCLGCGEDCEEEEKEECAVALFHRMDLRGFEISAREVYSFEMRQQSAVVAQYSWVMSWLIEVREAALFSKMQVADFRRFLQRWAASI
jgi:hypothetical protein